MIVDDHFHAAYPELEETALCQEWLRPAGIERHLQAHIAPWPSAHGELAVGRPARSGSFEHDAIAAMEAFRPHLLCVAEAGRCQALEALDRLRQGVLLVDARATVLPPGLHPVGETRKSGAAAPGDRDRGWQYRYPLSRQCRPVLLGRSVNERRVEPSAIVDLLDGLIVITDTSDRISYPVPRASLLGDGSRMRMA